MTNITKYVSVIVEGKVSPGLNKSLSKVTSGYTRIDEGNIKYINSTKKATASTYKFNSALLGTMFFGMGIQRTFSQMLQPAANLFGIFDIWGITLQTVFLPVMTTLFDVFLPFATFLMELPELVKIVIGVFVALAALFGTILFVVSSVALGMGALAFAGVVVGSVFALSMVIMWLLVSVFLVVKGIIDVVKGKFEGIGTIIMGIGGILLFFIGWWALIPIAIGAAVYLIIKHWESIKTFFVNIWEGIKKIFVVAINFLVDWFSRDPIISMIIKNWDKIAGFFKGVWEGVKSIFSSAWSGIWGIVKAYINLMIDGINFLIKGMNQLKFTTPDWVPGIGGKSFGVNIPEIPKLADGGIVTKPTLAMIGEAGPEAVVPLGKGIGSGITINQTISITGGLKDEVERMIRDNNRNLVDDIRRLTGVRG